MTRHWFGEVGGGGDQVVETCVAMEKLQGRDDDDDDDDDDGDDADERNDDDDERRRKI